MQLLFISGSLDVPRISSDGSDVPWQKYVYPYAINTSAHRANPTYLLL